jgi:hypothetical protein
LGEDESNRSFIISNKTILQQKLSISDKVNTARLIKRRDNITTYIGGEFA